MTPVTESKSAPTPVVPPPVVPPQMRADARRNHEAVLEAARCLFADQGFEAQMDEIARRAKVGVGTVYRHFPTKEDLLDALIARRFEALTERAAQAVEETKSGDAWEAFEGFIRFSAEIQTGDRALSEAMATRSERMYDAAVCSGLVPQLEELLKRTKRAGAVRKDLAVDDIPAMVCSIGSVAIAAAEKPGWRWDRVLAIWLDGIRAPGATKLPRIPS
ncbi:MAG: TetR/AcrR family transcriptional regulator [Solirubrobacterales bacterium]